MTDEPADLVEVFAWGQRVGVVGLDPETLCYAFTYDPAWVADGYELAPLHMALRTQPYEFPDLRPDTFYRLPPLLADALPDAFGNALVNRAFAEEGIAADRITPLDRLAYAADRAMGALEFRPPARSPGTDEPTALQLADLVLAARLTVSGEFADDRTSHEALRELIQVGTSAGGTRAKAVVAFHPTTYQIRSAHGPTAESFQPWLIKLDGVSGAGMDGRRDRLDERAPYGRIEYAYAKMAMAAGLEMMPCMLLSEGPRRHFMTQRFDRGERGERHHMISLCALAHLDYNSIGVHSYDQYLQAVVALGLDGEQLQQAYRRMVFNVIAVNRDDHTKNFAFMRPADGGWRLTPAFDLTYAYRPDSKWNSRHLMAINGKFDGITREDLFAVGERRDVPGYRRIVREVQQAVVEWPTFAAEAELEDPTVREIAADLERFRPR